MPTRPKPRKPGRPALPKGSAKAEMLRIRVAPATRREIEAKAKGQNQNVSEWIRSTLGAALEASAVETKVKTPPSQFSLRNYADTR